MPTMTAYYSLDNAINLFFTDKTVTRQQCENFALSYAGGQVKPVQIQGAFSYTLTAGPNASKLLQFRTQDSSFDLDVMNFAKTVHPELVASCKYHGTIGEMQPLYIYEMDNLPGTTYIMTRDVSPILPSDSVCRQRTTLKDLSTYD